MALVRESSPRCPASTPWVIRSLCGTDARASSRASVRPARYCGRTRCDWRTAPACSPSWACSAMAALLAEAGTALELKDRRAGTACGPGAACSGSAGRQSDSVGVPSRARSCCSASQDGHASLSAVPFGLGSRLVGAARWLHRERRRPDAAGGTRHDRPAAADHPVARRAPAGLARMTSIARVGRCSAAPAPACSGRNSTRCGAASRSRIRCRPSSGSCPIPQSLVWVAPWRARR